MFWYRDSGIEDYLRPLELIGLDWITQTSLASMLLYSTSFLRDSQFSSFMFLNFVAFIIIIIIMFYYAKMAATHIHEYTNTSTKSKKLEKR